MSLDSQTDIPQTRNRGQSDGVLMKPNKETPRSRAFSQTPSVSDPLSKESANSVNKTNTKSIINEEAKSVEVFSEFAQTPIGLVSPVSPTRQSVLRLSPFELGEEEEEHLPSFSISKMKSDETQPAQ